MAGWARYRPPAALLDTAALILPDRVKAQVSELPPLLRSGETRALVLRGPRHNGRHTVLGAVARTLGRGVLEIAGMAKGDDDRWRHAGLLAVGLNALPVLEFDLAPGETIDLPTLGAYDGPLGVVLGKQGGLSGPGAERALTLTIDLPDACHRREHWRSSLPCEPTSDLEPIADRFRLTAGNIRRAAALARSYAVLSGRPSVATEDVQHAARSLNREALDALAARLPAGGDWRHLAAREETLRELMGLELRCRHRERLLTLSQDATGLPSNCGVRALFAVRAAPARRWPRACSPACSRLDLYRLDLSARGQQVHRRDREEPGPRVLARRGARRRAAARRGRRAADAAHRACRRPTTATPTSRPTSCSSGSSRFEGILVVTTNAGERIDAAFQRRMDVVVEFRAARTRASAGTIWQLHLPADACASAT